MPSVQENMLMDSVPGWYAGKNVLITGATGFMGQVLVEKLLRDCPDIKCLYLMIREKKGVSPFDRKNEYFECVMFDQIKKTNPSVLDKVYVVKGDVLVDGLGLSKSDEADLITSTNIVFHCAAEVRFDRPLKRAIEMNCGGTLRMLELAEKMKNLNVFVHVSTCFSHCPDGALEERNYTPPFDPVKLLKIIRTYDEELLDKITPKLLDKIPNTYSYSKAITEGLVGSYGNRLPLVVCRPSIVVAALKDPLPGWVQGVNGPTGLMIGAARGVIRTMHCNPDYPAVCVPVDTAINALIAAAWDRAHMKSDKTEFYNVVVSSQNLITWGESIESGRRIFYENPLCLSLWYPDGSIKKNYYSHVIATFLFQIIPAYFIDALLFICRQKTFMVRVQKKISMGLQSFHCYSSKYWVFRNEKLEKLKCKLNLRDQDVFDCAPDQLNYEKYMFNYIMGIRSYILNEPKEDIPRAKVNLRRLFILDCVVKTCFFIFLFYYLWPRLDATFDYAQPTFDFVMKPFTSQGKLNSALNTFINSTDSIFASN